MKRWIVVVLSGLCATAFPPPAQADDAVRRLEVAVDSTLEIEVGVAKGYRCDDPKLVEGSELKTVGDRNVWVLKGAATGKTLCRVGTEPGQPSMLFEVVVTDKQAPKPRPRVR